MKPMLPVIEGQLERMQAILDKLKSKGKVVHFRLRDVKDLTNEPEGHDFVADKRYSRHLWGSRG